MDSAEEEVEPHEAEPIKHVPSTSAAKLPWRSSRVTPSIANPPDVSPVCESTNSVRNTLKGRDILTAKTYECTYHSGDMVDAPITSREEYTCLSVDDGSLSLLTKTGEMKEDVNLPEAEHLKDVAAQIKQILDEGKKECLVTVLDCMGTELAIEVREGAEQ